MWCPECSHEQTRVIGTDKSFVVERFRRCCACGYSFSTLEAASIRPHPEEPVKSKPYHPEKNFASMPGFEEKRYEW